MAKNIAVQNVCGRWELTLMKLGNIKKADLFGRLFLDQQQEIYKFCYNLIEFEKAQGNYDSHFN